MTDIVTNRVTRKQFNKFMNLTRGMGWKYWVCGNINLTIENKDDRYFPGYSVLKVSASQARKWADCALSETLEKRGARLTIKYDADKKNMWIG